MLTRPSGVCHTAVLMLGCLLLASCAHMDSSEQVVTVSIDPVVVMPKQVSYLTRDRGQGLIAIMIYYHPFPVAEKLEENHVDMGEILVEEMRTALGHKSGIRVVDHDADLVMHLTIDRYGFFPCYGLSQKMMVLLEMETKVTRHEGKLFYSDPNRETGSGDMIRNIEEYFTDPSVLQMAFHQVAAQAAADQAKLLAYHAGQLTLQAAQRSN